MGGKGSGRKVSSEQELPEEPSGVVVSPGVEEIPPPSPEDTQAEVVGRLREINQEEEPQAPKKKKKKRAQKEPEVDEERALAVERSKQMFLPATDMVLEWGVDQIPGAKPPTRTEKDIVSFGAGLCIEKNFENFERYSWQIFLFGGLALVFVPRLATYLKEKHDAEKGPEGGSDIRKDGERKELSSQADS